MFNKEQSTTQKHNEDNIITKVTNKFDNRLIQLWQQLNNLNE